MPPSLRQHARSLAVVVYVFQTATLEEWGGGGGGKRGESKGEGKRVKEGGGGVGWKGEKGRRGKEECGGRGVRKSGGEEKG